MGNRVEIHYCTGCKWLLRSVWMAQEFLSTFEDELSEVALGETRWTRGKTSTT